MGQRRLMLMSLEKKTSRKISTMTVKILAFDGSGRKGSANHQLLDIVATGARAAHAEVTFINLRDFDIPLYDGDLESEQGLPAGVKKLKALFDTHHAFLIASPEYNGSFTPLLKNALDWVSRPLDGDKPLQQFKGKIAAITSTSPGKLGGLRGLYQLQNLLFILQTIVLPDIIAVGGSREAFDDQGQLKDEKMQQNAINLGQKLAKMASALQSAA
jgi:chromate reductase